MKTLDKYTPVTKNSSYRNQIEEIKETLLRLSKDILEIKNDLKLIASPQKQIDSTSFDFDSGSSLVERNALTLTNDSPSVSIPAEIPALSVNLERSKSFGKTSNRILRGRSRPLRNAKAHYRVIESQKVKSTVKKTKGRTKSNQIMMSRQQNLKDNIASTNLESSSDHNGKNSKLANYGRQSRSNRNKLASLSQENETKIDHSVGPFIIKIGEIKICPICKENFSVEHSCSSKKI